MFRQIARFLSPDGLSKNDLRECVQDCDERIQRLTDNSHREAQWRSQLHSQRLHLAIIAEGCPKHASYRGIRKPQEVNLRGCLCRVIYNLRKELIDVCVLDARPREHTQVRIEIDGTIIHWGETSKIPRARD